MFRKPPMVLLFRLFQIPVNCRGVQQLNSRRDTAQQFRLVGVGELHTKETAFTSQLSINVLDALTLRPPTYVNQLLADLNLIDESANNTFSDIEGRKINDYINPLCITSLCMPTYC